MSDFCEAAGWSSPSTFIRCKCRPQSFLLNSNVPGSLDQHCSSPFLAWSVHKLYWHQVSLWDDTRATDDPLGSSCAWCILQTPLCLIPRESWVRVVPHHSMAWLDWFPASHWTGLRRSMSIISKGKVLGYYRNLGSLRYGNEYCVPGRAMNCTPRLLPLKKSELQWLERLII